MTEGETRALRKVLQKYPLRLSSRLATVEVSRAVARYPAGRRAQLPAAFEGVALIELTAEIAAAAADLAPAAMRTLDAIHVASARSVGDELGAFVTYDARQAGAAKAVGLHVESPA